MSKYLDKASVERKPVSGSRTDLDAEDDNTRKGETIKWLENHFGSESRSSKDDDFEETKKSYFNVTIKSNRSSAITTPTKYQPIADYNSNLISPSKVIIPERETSKSPGRLDSDQWMPDIRQYTRNTVSPANRFRDVDRNQNGSTSPAHIVHHKIVRDDMPAISKANRLYSSKGDLRYQRTVDERPTDHYTQSLKRDSKHRSESREQLYSKSRRENSDLYRSDSPAGYVVNRFRDESMGRTQRDNDDERLYEPKFKKSSVQRHDSAYFTAPRSPKLSQNRSLSGSLIDRDTTPVNIDSDYVRPSVPQRRRILERKLHLNGTNPMQAPKKQDEPAPDYNSSPSRSRSHSPPVLHTTSGGHKRYQRARFASEPARPIAVQTQPSTLAKKSTSTLSLKPASRVGSAITNSIRKFFGKIRSAGSGRKLKLKSKRSIASSSDIQPSRTSDFGSTYQQYYVIDGHIGNGKVAASRTKSDRSSRGYSDSEPKQKYYLGEDPYGGGTYGKENKYDGTKPQPSRSHQSSRRSRANDIDRTSPPPLT